MDRLQPKVAVSILLILVLAGGLMLFMRARRDGGVAGGRGDTAETPGDPWQRTAAAARNAAGSLRVRVTHKAGRMPIPGVCLALQGKDGPAGLEDSVTGGDGTFLAELPPGDYRVAARWGSVAESDERPFDIRAGRQTEVEIEFDTHPWVTIRGTVRTQDGKPVGKAKVILSYDRDEKVPKPVDDLLGGDGSLVATCDDEGRYEIKRVLYPWTYELYSRSSTHSPVPDRAPNVAIREDSPLPEFDVDLLVRELPYVNVRGRILGPDGTPARSFKLVVREYFVNDQGKATGFSETCCATDEDGRYAFRTTREKIQILSAHPVYQSPCLDVDTGLRENAFQTKGVDDFRLEEKQSVVKIRVQSETGAQRLEGEVQVHEYEGGGQDIVSFGNTSYSVRTDLNGDATLRVDPSKRYVLKFGGYEVVRTEGSTSGNRVRGVLVFPSGPGDVTLYVRRP